MEFRRVLFRSDQHVRHQHRARHHWADVVRRSQPAGALTLSQVERKTMTVLLYLFVAVLLATGLSLLRSEEHTSELQSLMRISYAVFCLKKKNVQTLTLNNLINMNIIMFS